LLGDPHFGSFSGYKTQCAHFEFHMVSKMKLFGPKHVSRLISPENIFYQTIMVVNIAKGSVFTAIIVS